MKYTTLVSAQAVREHLDDPAFVIVDCRHSLSDVSLGPRLYDEAHIPGAAFADVENDLAGPKSGTNGRHPMPDPDAFVRFLASLGADDDTQIVGYDAGADMFAARLWFLCRWIGHDAAAVLDGGYAAWQRLGYPVTAAPAQPQGTGTLSARPRSQMLVDADQVAKHLHHSAMQLLDARAPDRFEGRNETIDPVAGHIPGARNRWFKSNFNDDATFKNPDELRAEFSAAGIEAPRVVHQCGSGVSAAVNYLAMTHAGLEGSRFYGGSWSEWIADPSRPISTGSE